MKNAAKCCLLIGNSRWHWAIQNQKTWEFFHELPPNTISSLLKKNLWRWAAVGNVPSDINLDPSKELKLENIPLQNAPEWLGIDRALGGWGAFQKAKSKNMHSEGLLLADAGTILSLTCITSKGEFTGGQLIAGLNLQRLSMAEKTLKLKKPKINCLPELMFPSSTDEAILRGSFQSLVGALIEAQKESKMPIWLCGGDAGILFKNLKNRLKIIYSPNIVLEGMISINL